MRRRRTESFLLRIVVPEEGGPVSEEWRGRVQHIGTGVEQSFAGIEDLIGFIATHLQPVESDVAAEESLPHS